MAIDPRAVKPAWLKVRAPSGARYRWLREQRSELELATVCEEARCPNIGECWAEGTATFMVMGSICTRGCRFCAVTTRKKGVTLDPEEPAKLARTIAAMKLNYIVITSVDRDDLADQGASHFASCVEQVRLLAPQTRIEVLHPDFRGQRELVEVVATSGADVLGHNVETVRRLSPTVRDPRCDYDQSLAVLRYSKEISPQRFTKSSIMVGHGESEDEVIECMRDLREVGVDLLTVGQYLRPSSRYMPVEEYVHPTQFERYEQIGKELGFLYVASGPLVRSSYKAGEFFINALLDERDSLASHPVSVEYKRPVNGAESASRAKRALPILNA
jgi:lipoic acid synthetase